MINLQLSRQEELKCSKTQYEFLELLEKDTNCEYYFDFMSWDDDNLSSFVVCSNDSELNSLFGNASIPFLVFNPNKKGGYFKIDYQELDNYLSKNQNKIVKLDKLYKLLKTIDSGLSKFIGKNLTKVFMKNSYLSVRGEIIRLKSLNRELNNIKEKINSNKLKDWVVRGESADNLLVYKKI